MYKNELYVSIKITSFAGHFPALESLAHLSSSLVPNRAHFYSSAIYIQYCSSEAPPTQTPDSPPRDTAASSPVTPALTLPYTPVRVYPYG
jgi:hypothetical protein